MNILLDELGRPGDHIFDLFLDGTDRQDVDQFAAPVIWGTTNFMPASERTEAMRDRFGMWVWITPSELNVKDFASSALHAMIDGMEVLSKLPTVDEIEAIQRMTPGPLAENAIGELLEVLTEEAEKGVLVEDNKVNAINGKKINAKQFAFHVHPRRIAQWAQLVFRYSAYLTGSDNFSVVPNKASSVLKWAWPTMSHEEWQAWAQVSTAVGDVVGAAIQEAQRAAYEKFRQIAQKIKSADPQTKVGLIMELGNFRRHCPTKPQPISECG